jgi:hypothetical protein
MVHCIQRLHYPSSALGRVSRCCCTYLGNLGNLGKVNRYMYSARPWQRVVPQRARPPPARLDVSRRARIRSSRVNGEIIFL